jgi:molybdopterin molybdotransferase
MHAVLTQAGVALDFWKIAMRPGKPLMFGRMGAMRCLGLPGNPVASMVCAEVFLRPLVERLSGRAPRSTIRRARLGADMPANDLRQDYVRAALVRDGDRLIATPYPVQDSSMLRLLAESGALIIRPPFAPAAPAGSECEVMLLREAVW